jgi:hypothetical protein
MTTTEQRAGSDGETAAVVSLAERQTRRANLEHLLDLRSCLAAIAAAQRSHNLAQAWQTTRLLYSVEKTINDGWPDVYARRLPSWAGQDDAMMHSPTRLVDDCCICRAIADRHGINLHPPTAA